MTRGEETDLEIEKSRPPRNAPIWGDRSGPHLPASTSGVDAAVRFTATTSSP